MAASPAGADGERHGLRGDYYLSSGPGAFDFAELKATIVDSKIEMPDLEPVFRDLTGRTDDITVRWTGRIRPEFSETYTFSMIGDNGYRLWVNNQLIIDHWVDDWDVEQIGTPIKLEAGVLYDFKLEYFEHYGGSNLRLRWESPSVPKQIVPADAFFLPEGFDPPGPDAAEVDAEGLTLTLDFAEELARLPRNAHEHLALNIAGTAWPITSASLKPGDRSVIVAKLKYPVPMQTGPTLRTSYDGQGGITTVTGEALAEYKYAIVTNGSRYTLKTRWTDKVNPRNPLPEYPRPQLVRNRWRSLNGEWQFAAAKEGEAPPIGRDLDERIVVPFPVESQLSGLQRHEERMFYRRTFTVPDGWRRDRVILHFDAVDWEATVYVNGQEVGTHRGGFDRFSIDVTDALKPKGAQELVVAVYDPTDEGGQPVGKQRLNPGGIWYTPVSGIWQSVWLEPVPRSGVESLKMVPDVAGESLKVTVGTAEGSDVTAEVTAHAKGRKVGEVTGAPGQELRLPVPKPRLWSPEDPFLYDLTVRIRDGRRVVETVRSYFGMRTISVGQVDGTTRILLNGEPVFHMGPLDQGFWPDGIFTAPTDEALRFDLEETKRLGFNMTRKHVKVEPDRWYYHADRLGLLVWQDMPSMAGSPDEAERAQFETELREVVDQHFNSPSVVMWVPFNEGWGQYDQARIADLVKSWDPSRLVNNMSGVNCCGAVDGGNGDVVDSHIYPGPGTPVPPSATRASVLGEYGGLAMPVIGHTWSGGGWGYATEPDPEALTSRYADMSRELNRLRQCNGLSAAVYTQITDVETEVNGLLTYDRAITKPDVKRIRDANRSVIDNTPASC
ncbi:PA14 domain-containing protein [Thermostaphylospora chromogena]|uniref:PA14 domain-containing protein n=1 Tax=Thermostaphylospora chromogena TaxID=35622 RepID=UPI001A9661D2|nr:PA14 domain-containing protein [Thermostaphylospora chromogena]